MPSKLNSSGEGRSPKTEGDNIVTSEHDEVSPASGEIKEIVIEAVSYGPDGVSGLFNSGYVLGAAALASLGGLSFGYDQGVISIINVMDEFHRVFPAAESSFGKGFMTGMLLLGAFVGCLFMPYIADRISRKFALTVAVVVFNIGAIMQTAAESYE